MENEEEEPTEASGRQRPRDATAMTPGASSLSKRENPTEAQDSTPAKKRATTKPSTEKRTATPADETPKQRQTGKTDKKNDDMHMPVESRGFVSDLQ